MSGRRNVAPILPRLLTREQAAIYCGQAVDRFVNTCPVEPITLGESQRLNRWDRHRLDQWIDSMGSPDALSSKDWLDRL